jgi:ATP-dependent Lon protease
VGGEILFIEATDMPGNGNVILTGKLGDVMKESARISLSLLKSRLPMNTFNFKEKDLHIHVPSGAVPKDGPSAGIALFTALASLVTGHKVDSKLAMTGEITLRGAVLPIGGLKEKLLGAQRAGIKTVLIPKDNLVDLKDVPDEVKKDLTVIAVETVEDVLKETLGISLPRLEQVLMQKEGSGRLLEAFDSGKTNLRREVI